MSNPLATWWRSHQFFTALKQGKTHLAGQILQEIQASNAKLNWLEKFYRDKLQIAQLAHEYKREVLTLGEKLRDSSEKIEQLESKLDFRWNENHTLEHNSEFIEFISRSFKLIEHDEHNLQCTGIDKPVFDSFESNLVEYLQLEFDKIPSTHLTTALKDANKDIDKLRSGHDPEYSLNLTPHVYFMRYFLDNVYCAYIAWFLIYKYSGLPARLNILDIAAGPGTIAYSLSLLLKSSSKFFSATTTHISYYSLEQQALFQYRGLQFWRRYNNFQQFTTNAYFKFDTFNFLDYCDQYQRIPESFFDFVVISHCLFYDLEQRKKSYEAFRNIFANCLKKEGFALLIVQGKKLFSSYNLRLSEDYCQEENIVRSFVEELGLSLEWYKYITSTGKRTPIEDFAKFAVENLPKQEHMNKLRFQHFGLKHAFHYTLDDYIILAKK